MGGLVVAPLWGAICGAIAFVCVALLRRPHLIGVVAIAMVSYVGGVMVYRVSRLHPFPDAGWPVVFDDLHRLGMAAVVLLLAGICVGGRYGDAASD